MQVGIDVLDIARMEKLIKSDKFLEKYFTTYEIEYVAKPSKSTRSLAGLYAAKEAFLKALGIGIGGGIDLKDIEIRHKSSGKPYLQVISEKGKELLKKMEITEIEINISHTDTVSTAVCVLK